MNESTSPRESFIDRGGWWVVSQSVLLLGVVAAGPLDQGTAPAWSFLTGVILFCLAGGIGIAGVVCLDRNRTAYPRPRYDSRLITRGIYAWLRHPLYTCLVMASLGWSALFYSRSTLVATLPLALFLVAKARREERWLLEQFPDYAGYRRRVAGFIPGIF
jgi:protein-S-isoprenylcysteine O-methyltransferase Ste14